MNTEGRSAPDAYGVDDELAELRAGLKKADPNLTNEQVEKIVGFMREVLEGMDSLLRSTLERLAGAMEEKADQYPAGPAAPGLRLAAQITRKTVELY